MEKLDKEWPFKPPIVTVNVKTGLAVWTRPLYDDHLDHTARQRKLNDEWEKRLKAAKARRQRRKAAMLTGQAG